jgi:hypothetical protein
MCQDSKRGSFRVSGSPGLSLKQILVNARLACAESKQGVWGMMLVSIRKMGGNWQAIQQIGGQPM